jgi:hypothetical protein
MMSTNMILEDNCEVVFSSSNDPISAKEEIPENTFDSIIASARWDLKFEDICIENYNKKWTLNDLIAKV